MFDAQKLWCETCLWKARYFMLIPIVLLILGFMLVTGLGIFNLIEATQLLFNQGSDIKVLGLIINIIDLVLISMILLIFAWGTYELFIEPLDVGDRDKATAEQLFIHDIDELKEKLGKVIIVSIIVHIFKQVLIFEVQDRIDLLVLAGIVVIMSLALGLLSGGMGFGKKG